jgi:hypothetical protein
MALSLSDVQRIAVDVAQQQQLDLDVIGVTRREGSSTSAEVVFAVRDCGGEPCRVVIGVSRQISEGECRGMVRTRLQERLAERLN